MSEKKVNNLLIIALLVIFFPVGLYLMIKSGWQKKVKWIVASAFIAWFLFLGLAVYFSPPTIEVANLRTDKTLIAENAKFKVEGKVFPYGSEVTVNEQSVTPDEDGQFTLEITLNEGENTIKIRVADGDKVTEELYKVQYVIKEEQPESTAAEDAESKEQADQEAKRQQRQAERWYWHRVVRVVDGDTVVANVDGKDTTIRIIGINSPESTTRTECFGKEASAKAKEFLSGKWIQLERDDTQTERDKYNRLLRYVWFDNGTDFGRRMIEEGYAYEYTYNIPYNNQAQYKQTQANAEKNDIGLWSSKTCSGSKAIPEPVSAPAPTPKATPAPAPTPSTSSGGVVKMSRTGICHAPGTTYYSRTTNYTGYNSLDACLQAGGRMPLR